MKEEKKQNSERPVSDMPPADDAEQAKETGEPKKGSRAWWQRHKPSKRRLIQVYAALLFNANIRGFASGTIYQGNSKYLCVPGLNCYSCPGAIGACPLGALQNALFESNTRAPYYILGIIILFGLIFARTICGFLCPVGLGQELLYKIGTPKLKKNRITYILSYFKYVLLAALVVAVPLLYSYRQTAIPGFCKYVCPAGTFGGAIGLLLHPANATLFEGLGGLFTWKFVVLVAVVALCIFLYRAFCRFLCPLGAIYGFFNKIALLGIKLDRNKCTDCGLCVSHCKMDIRKVGDHECINCGECIDVCPAKAIGWKGSKLFVHENAVAPAEERPLDALLSKPSSELSAASLETQTVAETENKGTMSEGAAVKTKRGRQFWIKVGAWGAAVLLLLSALLYYNVFAVPSAAAAESGNAVGDLCYDFTLPCYGGREEVTLSDFRGKVVLVNFWATWCGPCVQELPEFERVAEKYGDSVAVIAVHSAFVTSDVQNYIDTREDIYDPSRTWKDWKIVFAQDSGEGMDSETYQLLGGRNGAYPYTLVVDRTGVISYIFPGSATYETLEEQVRNCLS